ncbi:MAG TPA: hypothetical protein PK295_01450 [Candidatus Magasanikbacteria bacterium]|nr:hypothetical protein [Candidatus Magasanikbacteria bacterium]
MSIKSEVFEFFVEGKNSHLSHVLLHIASPGKPDGENQGYFFVLAEIDRPESSILGIIEELITDGEALYYSEYDGETKNAEDPEAKHFESVIEKLNRRAKALLEDEERKIHIAVGVILGNKLSFAYRGDILALLAYSTPEGPSFTRITDEAVYPEHIFFSSVIEGNFTTDEAVYISTPHIIKYFSCDRIAKMIIGKPAKQSAHQVQKTLEAISSEYSFGGLVLTGTEIVEPVRIEKNLYRPIIGSEESMDKLLDTTRSTEETLSPKVFSHLAKSLTGGMKRDSEDATSRPSTIRETKQGRYKKRKRGEGESEDGTSTILIMLGKSLVWIARALFYVLKTLTFALGKFIAVVWSLISNYNGSRKILIEGYKATFKRMIGRITGLGMFGKIMLLTLIVGIAILIASIMYMKAKQKEVLAEEQYQAQIVQVDEKQKEVESYLLYGENTKALVSLRSAESLLDSLNHETPEKKAHADEIKAELAKLLVRVQKITAITPEKIVDIKSTIPNAKPDSLVLAGDKLIATGKADSSLYFVSTLTGTVEAKNAETARQLSQGYTAKDNSQVVFISGSNTIVAYDNASDSIVSKTIGYPNQSVVLADIALYNGRLYALDSGNGTLYRHNPTQVGYDNGIVWLKTIQDQNILKEGVSFGIDGDLFIATSKGKIIKLSAGEEQPFEITGLDPALESPTLIETNSEFGNLYILEPSKKRVIMLDKEGTFKKQFTSDQWTNPTGLTISADEKQAYILDGTTVYKFKL